jgi:NAD(P)-dependent dehydrogenase (short-subunit alcohol dehydrogenase family)
MKIEGSVALVTGANRGLGKAIVAALLEAGAAKVYAAARDASRIASDDPRVVPLALDTTKPEQIAAVARTARDVTLLVNNAGVQTSWSVLAASAAELDADFRTNVFGMLALVRAMLPVLERAQGATIVNVLSLSSLASFPPLGGYAASKAAAYSVTQALRAELKAKQIDVLAALPGPIDTDMVRALPIAKTSPAEVARGVLLGITRGDEEILPDPVAQQLGALWSTNPKAVEQALANY